MPRKSKAQKDLESLKPVVNGRTSSYADLEGSVFLRDKARKSVYLSPREYQSSFDDFDKDTRKNIIQSMWAYKKVGLIRNAIDLQADFACDGIRFVSDNEKDQQFLDEWSKKIDLNHVSERFCNMMFRTANVLVQRTHAKITSVQYRKMQQAVADEEVRVPKKRIPWSYAVNSPLNLTVMGGAELSAYLGNVKYGIRIPDSIISLVKNKDKATLEQAEQLGMLPPAVVEAINNGKDSTPLDPDKTRVYHYKKDDWEIWADPIITSFFDDVLMLNKLKLCDMSILDGATQRRTLWTVGDLQNRIIPNQAALDSFADMLKNHTDNGEQDIVFGPAVNFKESSSEFYKYLGSEKYGATYRAIYEGLGIPYIITGEGGSASSSLSVRVMINRLEYVRKQLNKFWLKELREVEKAMDLSPGTKIVYKHINLSDPVAELALYVQLADRNLISIETIQERFGEVPEIELVRQRKEQKQIDKGKRLRRASQWHNPEHKESLQKAALAAGIVTPSEIGLDLLPRKDGEKSAAELKQAQQEAKAPGESGQGRPPNSKDKVKRTRTSKASFVQSLATEKKRFDELSKYFTPEYLSFSGKKNVRSLTDAEFDFMEERKFAAFCSQNNRSFDETFADESISIHKNVLLAYESIVKPDMSVEERRECMVYAYLLGDENGEDDN